MGPWGLTKAPCALHFLTLLSIHLQQRSHHMRLSSRTIAPMLLPRLVLLPVFANGAAVIRTPGAFDACYGKGFCNV